MTRPGLIRAFLLAVSIGLVASCAARADVSTLQCEGDLAGAALTPVLLIHGTASTAQENWSWGYEKALRDRGEPFCTIDLPQRATIDMQDTLPVTADAIREMSRRAGGRKISIIGHSQGASQGVFALRQWPQLAALVDDVIGLSGVYDRGSEALRKQCASRCIQPFWQLSPGSRLLAALATRPLPSGPSVTAIGTLYDDVVTPQPQANFVPGGRSFEIQDICPGRHYADGFDHTMMAADAVAYAAAIDALDHPGPADPARVDRINCQLRTFADVDGAQLALLAPDLAGDFRSGGYAPTVEREPELRCPFAAGCDVVAGFRLASRFVVARRFALLRARVARAGSLRLRFGDTATAPAAVAPGWRLVRIAVPPLRPGAYGAIVEAQSLAGTPWAQIGSVRLRVRR